MMLREDILRFVSGRVYFEASNGFRELFLRSCNQQGIELFDVFVSDNGLHANVRYNDAEKIHSAASKSGMDIVIRKRSGLKHLFVKYRRRCGIPAGLLLAVIITAVLSSFIWSVDISGNSAIPYEDLVEMLSEAGIEKGRFRNAVDCDDAEFYLLNRIPQLSWISVYSAGSRVFVDIREREETQAPADKITYTNIIASKDGEIVQADIFTGDGKLYPGTAVLKGELLVNGVVTMRDGGVKFVNSDAVIKARTRNFISSSASDEISVERLGESKDVYKIYFFGLSIPLGIGKKDCRVTESKYFFDSSDVIFPVGIVRCNYSVLEADTVTLSEAQSALLAFSDFSEGAVVLCENTEILESEIMLNFASQVFVEGKFLCIEDIAQKKQFTVEDNGENSALSSDGKG